ncbi:uncharacterized protein LOC124668587 isoform X1 [Lolium rigidum]|uniref:uncharacterized protein LOC124668587 isoform X1 n=1 Tax=Lolium rigidum TaxID=89674 RepID=UPI001F5E1090|nr:uncharacterized protein LOC124668587 isoform X1 [Lolium rigidum]
MPQFKSAPAPEPVLLVLDDGDETVSEGSGSGPSTPDARGKEASSSSTSATPRKRKHGSLSCGGMGADDPEAAGSDSSDTTWSVDSVHDRHRFSLSRRRNVRSEPSVTSGTLLGRPRGVLRLRTLPQNDSIENEAGGRKVLQSNGISKAAHFVRRKKKRKPRVLKENRVGGDDPVCRLNTEHDHQDGVTRSWSENGLLVEKLSRLSGEPSDPVHVDKEGSAHLQGDGGLSVGKQSRLSGEPSNPLHADKESSGHVQQDDDATLEENAAMMLCSLSDNRHAHPSRKKSPDKSSKEPSFQHRNRFKDPYNTVEDVAGPSRMLRRRGGKAPFSKRRPRRHFYEVNPRDQDPYKIIKERIRVFWPLDETWYFGLVKEYDPVKGLHFVKYDDKDEEWINLQNERIKLLLLPAEGRKRSNHKPDKVSYEEDKREDMDGNSPGSSDSEPTVSWSARSNQARPATSSNIVKPDHGQSNIVPVLSNSFDANQEKLQSDDAIPGSSLFANGDEEVHDDGNRSGDRRFHVVYSRKRVCRGRNCFVNNSEHDLNPESRSSSAAVIASVISREADTETGAVKHVMLVLSLPLKSVYKLVSEACSIWIFSSLFHPQHGSLISLWPAVFLDILFVDNALGLKHLLLRTCLRSAVSLFCSLVGSFNQCSGQSTSTDSKSPCTSVRFQISGLDGRSQVVFVLFSIFGICKSQWKNLQAKLRYHSLKRELSKANCTYANIKQLTDGTDQVGTSMDIFSKSLSFDFRGPQFPSESNYPDVDPVIFCLDNQSEFTKEPLDLPAPSLLLCHHLKLLIESNLISSGLVHLAIPSEISSEKDQQSISQHASDFVNQDGPLDMDTIGSMNHSSSASRKHDTTDCTVSLDCNDSSDGDINVTSERCPDQNGRYVAGDNSNRGDKMCSSVHNVTNSPEKSKQWYPSIDIPQDKTSDPPDDERKDGKASEPVSNLVQELNEYPIGGVTPTAPRTTFHRNRFTSISRTFGDGSKLWPEDGSKKPRTPASYSVSPRSDELGLKHKGHFRKIQTHSAKTNGAKRFPDNTRSGESSPESLTCVANILVTVGDRGWREYDTQIKIDTDGQSDRRICVRLAEGIKYAHKVCQALQPGATNRYTHAILWKGGPEWCLEFPDRSQWAIFKQMHGECYNHNIRAASVKNIPIPGVRMVEGHDDNGGILFVRPQDYLCHIGPDVEMALDESRVIYDMDSDDEEWISGWRKSQHSKNSTVSELTEDLFEKVMDKFEKFAHTHNCNELTIDQIKELDMDDVPLDIIEVIHDHWHDKRQKKGIPLVRHFQPVMWKIYGQQLEEWESAVQKIQGVPNGYQQRRLPPKPAMFAFCLKPRGRQLQIPSKGSKGPKQRSHKKLMYSGSHSFSREQDGFHRQVSGRRNGEYLGDGKTCESYDGGSLYSPTGYSPRFSTRTESPRAFDAPERGSTPRFIRTNSVKRNASLAFSEDHQASPSIRNQRIKRGAVPDHWNTAIHEYQNSKQMFPGPPQSHRIDVEELKLRDAMSAAQHAAAMARLKRERAHCLMHKADLAAHKASVAVMIAEAIKASSSDSSRASDIRRDLGDEER